MSELQQARLSVPETATAALIRWVITPPGGRMKLYRTRTDPDPLLIEGSHGDLEVELVEPCTLYYEFFPETQNFKIFTTGWRDPAGRGGGP